MKNTFAHTVALPLLSAVVLSACGGDGPPPAETSGTDGSSSSSTTGQPSTTATASGSSSSTTKGGASESSGSGTGSSRTSGSESGSSTGEMQDTPRVLQGFSVPESAHWHAASSTWFVSNIAGEIGAPDGQGWITRLDADLEVLDAQWLDGLDSPAGLVSSDDTLYVADLHRVLAIDVATATVEESWTVEGGLLNDTALHADGTVYVSDTFANAVVEVRSGADPVVLVQDETLAGPNGLLIDGDTLYILSTASFTDLEREAAGYRYDLIAGVLTPIDGLVGKFDGIEPDGDGFLITDFRGTLMRLDADDTVTTLHDFVSEGLVTSTADLGYDVQLGRVLIPDLFGDQVLIYDVK